MGGRPRFARKKGRLDVVDERGGCTKGEKRKEGRRNLDVMKLLGKPIQRL